MPDPDEEAAKTGKAAPKVEDSVEDATVVEETPPPKRRRKGAKAAAGKTSDSESPSEDVEALAEKTDTEAPDTKAEAAGTEAPGDGPETSAATSEKKSADAEPATESAEAEPEASVKTASAPAEPAGPETELSDTYPEDPAAPSGRETEHAAETGTGHASVPPPPPPPQADRRGSGVGIVALVLVALVIGGGAVWFLRPPPPGNQAEIDRLSAQIAALNKSVEAGQKAPQPAGPDPALTQLKDTISSSISGLSDKLSAVDNRMSQIEKRPAPGTPQQVTDALSSLTADLKAANAENAQLTKDRADLRAQVTKLNAQMGDLQKKLDAANAQVASLQGQSAATEAERKAAALTRLQAAVVTGHPYQAAASTFEQRTGSPLPDVLAAHAATGVPTAAALTEAFPDAARAGLAASLTAQKNEGVTARALDFLRAQIGLRSVTPRQGNGPDAVLSRAQAAVQKGDFAAALSDISALPQAGKDAMSGWVSDAQAHIDAGKALAALAGG